jgi:hypothetical protein
VTKVPAAQTEQVEDDVALVTTEYVPAKASDEKYEKIFLKTSTQVNTRRENARRWGREYVSQYNNR